MCVYNCTCVTVNTDINNTCVFYRNKYSATQDCTFKAI